MEARQILADDVGDERRAKAHEISEKFLEIERIAHIFKMKNLGDKMLPISGFLGYISRVQRGGGTMEALLQGDLWAQDADVVDMKRRSFFKYVMSMPLGYSLIRLFSGRKRKNYLLNVFSVAGYGYYNGESIINGLRRGEVLRLVPEPHNEFDGFAVEIRTSDGIKLGYVPRSDNRAIFRLLRQGAKVVGRVEAIRPEEPSWRRVKVSVWLVG